MPKPKNFSPDVAALPIADKAKRVIEEFLNADCMPSIALSPKRAEKLRRAIIHGVVAAIDRHEYFGQGNISTLALGYELTKIADAHRNAHRRSVSARLEVLADLFKSISGS